MNPDRPVAFRLMTAGRRLAVRAGPLLLGKSVLLLGNALLLIVLGRRLPAFSFALITTVFSAQMILSRILLFGVDVSALRLQWTAEDSNLVRGAAARILLCAVSATAFLSVAVTVAGQLGVWIGSVWWLPLMIAAGAIGLAFIDYAYWQYLARLNYARAALLQGGSAFLRAALGIWAVLAGWSNPFRIVALLVGIPLVIGLAANRGEFSLARRARFSEVRKLLRYSGWQAVSTVFGTISLQFGAPLLWSLRKPVDAAIIGFAAMIGTGGAIASQAMQEFLISRAAQLSQSTVSVFLRKATALSVLSAAVLLGALVVAFDQMARLMDPRLSSKPAVFWLISFSLAVYLLHAPLEAVCHYLLRPSLIVISRGARVLIAVGLGFHLGASQGAPGVALAQLIAAVCSLFLLAALTMAAILKTRGERALAAEANARL